MKKIFTLLFLAALVCVKGWGQVANYNFNQNGSGNYTAITGGTILGSTSNDDEVFFTTAGATTTNNITLSGTGFSLPFSFVYNGSTYDHFAVNANGFITLGTGTFSILSGPGSNITPISNGTTGVQNIISAMGFDLQGQQTSDNGKSTNNNNTLTSITAGIAAPGMTVSGTGIPANTYVTAVSGTTVTMSNNATSSNNSSTYTFNSTILFKTVGSTLVIQWAGYRGYGASGDLLNFQIILTQSTNTVQFVYGTNITGSSYQAQVGIRGTTNGDYNNRSVTSNGASWSSSTTGSSNTAIAKLNNTTAPASGLTYTFTSPTPSLSVTTLSPAFGAQCINGTYGPSTFTVTGSNLTSTVGIATSSGYTYSTTSNGTYSSSFTLAPSGGSINQTVYVKFSPSAVTNYNTAISVTSTGASSQSVAVNGSGVNLPTTVTNGTPTVTSTTASVSATISPSGCSTVTAYGIEYSTNSSFANGSGTHATTTLSGTTISANITALTPSTQYYYHAYATNSGGTTYTSGGTFTTATPTLSVNPTSLSFGSVCTNASSSPSSFIITGTNLTTANVTVGTQSGYTYSTTSGGTYSATLSFTQSGGSFSQTVYVQLSPTATTSYNGNIAVSGGGASSINEGVTGSGVNTAPTVTAGNATGITTSSATLPGTITSNGCTVISDYGIVYSATSFTAGSGGTKVSATSQSSGNFSVNLTGLTQSTTYYYYTYAKNSASTSYSSPISTFTTSIPAISTSVSGSTFCAGASIAVSFTSKGTFAAGNTYTAVLSNAGGSFSSGITTLGTLTNNNSNSGSITGTIPTSASGTGYRVKVTSTNPTITGSDNGNDLSINTPPAAITVTPTTKTICANSSQLLTVTGAIINNAIALSENFDGGGLPSGWSRTYEYAGPFPLYPDFYSTSENPNSSGNTWPSPNAGYGGTGECMYFYTRSLSRGIQGDLFTPTLNLSSYSSATLTFYIFNSGGNDVLDVYATLDNNNYQQINSISYGVYGTWTKIVVPIPSNFVGSGKNTVTLVFEGTSDGGGSNIAIDNVVVSGTAQAPITWSPITNLSPSTGASVTAAPTATTTYTATATDPITGCTATGTSTLTVTPLSTASFGSTSYFSCAGIAAQPIITGTAGSSISYTIGGTAQTPVTLPTGAGTTSSTTLNSSTNQGTYNYIITGVGATSSTCAVTNLNNPTTVTVYGLPPLPTFTVTPGTYVQIGNSATITPNSTGGTWANSNSTATTFTSTTSNATVTGVAPGTSFVTYTTAQDSHGCKNSANQTITVTADYITKQAGNFSQIATWYKGTTSGYVNATVIPASSNTIQVAHALTLDVDFQVGATKSFGIITGGTLTILPNKTFSSAVGSTVDFGGKSVTVKSVAPTSVSGNDVTFGTGAIGQMLGTFNGASNVTAERYIGSTAFSSGRRAWRLVTAPVTNTTINGAWQEGAVSSTSTPANPNTGYGTLITGFGQGSAANAANNGFDYWSSIAGNTTSSIRKYVPNSTGGTWASYTTIANLTINSQPAYMLFVRGDRSAWNASSTSANLNTKGITTLRATGTLNQGTQTTLVPAGNSTTYTVVGNPYASTINFEQIYTASTNIASRFYTWNSQNGSYGAYTLVTRTGTNTYTITPNYLNTGNTNNNFTTNPQYIASGEGFLVQPSSSTANGSVVIGENAKVSASAAVINPYRLTPNTEAKLYVNINLVNADSTTTLADGILARYDASYSAQIDEDDAAKQTNFNENLAVESNSTDLIVEARPDIQRKDTLQLKLWNVSLRSYQLQIKGDNFAQSVAQGLHAYLEDSYLKTREEVSLSGAIATAFFTVTTDTASYNPHRFRIVFQSASSVLPVTITHIKAALQNGGVAVSWTTGNEATVKEYTVERSVDEGASFASLTAQAAKNAAGVAVASYGTFDAAPHRGDNLYRIRVEGEDGKLTYSEVAKVAVGGDEGGRTLITLYPNPVSRREGKATLVLKNVEKGEYLVSVYGGSGQALVEKKVTVGANAGTQTETITLPSSMAQGGYELRLTSHAGSTLFLDKLIIGK